MRASRNPDDVSGEQQVSFHKSLEVGNVDAIVGQGLLEANVPGHV